MKSKWRILSGFLFLVILVSVVLLGVTQANSSNDLSRDLTNPRSIQIYPSNITPDEETGIGRWTPQECSCR